MRAYTIALALFTFGFVIGMINGLDLYEVKLPDSSGGADISESQVQDLTSAATSGTLSPLQSIAALFMLGGVLFEAIKSALTIMPLLLSYGVHPLVALMIQGPIWLVYIVALVQFFTGRPLKGSE